MRNAREERNSKSRGMDHSYKYLTSRDYIYYRVYIKTCAEVPRTRTQKRCVNNCATHRAKHLMFVLFKRTGNTLYRHPVEITSFILYPYNCARNYGTQYYRRCAENYIFHDNHVSGLNLYYYVDRILFPFVNFGRTVAPVSRQARARASERGRTTNARGRRNTNARSLRFRFKTFELDWETPRVFAVPPGHLKLSRRATSGPSVVLTTESRPLQLPSRNYFRSLVLSAAPCRARAIRADTCWLVCRTSIHFHHEEVTGTRLSLYARARSPSRVLVSCPGGR